MPELSTADHSVSPPLIGIPRRYNAAHDLIARNLQAGRADKPAFIDDNGSYTYADVARRSARFANALGKLGVLPEQRVLMCVHDTIDFPTVFLGAIRAGVVPIAVNTLLTQGDYEYMLTDSGARVAVVSGALLPLFAPLLGKVPTLERIIVAGGRGDDSLAALLTYASDDFTTVEPRPTRRVSGCIPPAPPARRRAPCTCTPA